MTTEPERDYDQAPVRPSIAPAFAMGMLMWLTCAVVFTLGRTASMDACATVALPSGALAVLAAMGALRGRRRAVFLAVCAIAAGTALSASYAAVLHDRAAQLEDLGSSQVELAILEDSRDSDFGERALARIVSGPYAGACIRMDLGKGDQVRFGQRASGVCSFKRLDERNGESAWQKGACCTARLKGVSVADPEGIEGLLVSVRNAAIDAIGAEDDAHALLQALVCGYRRHVRESALYASFQTCGLAHLVAVSGAHLVIVTGMFASVFRVLRMPRRYSIVLLVVLMASYLVVSGMPVSALRAVAMSSLGLLSFFGKRRSSSQSALGVGAIALIAVNPSASVSASFALSALSTAGIVVFSPLFSYLIARTPLGRVGFIAESLSLTLSACLLSQLYACALFSQLPLISPLANIACAPLFPIVCASGLAASLACVAHLPFAGALVGLATQPAHVLNATVSLLATCPYACIPFSIDEAAAVALTAAMAVALWATWPSRMRTLLAAAVPVLAGLVVIAPIFAVPGDCIVMLNVGQGDAFYLQSRGASLLVDTGNQDSMLVEGLGRLHVAHVDSVLVTHADDDHCGSLDAIARTVDVNRVIVAKDMLACEDEDCREVVADAGRAAQDIVPVSYGDTFSVGAFEARVVWPRDFADNGGNADSLCLAVTYDGDDDGQADFTALFTGDAEQDELAQMIAAGDVGHVDLLKVGHHGSKNGMTAEEMDVLRPRIAFIGVGAGNRYGHPSDEALSLLENVGCAVYRSDRDGEVRCALSPEGARVSVLG